MTFLGPASTKVFRGGYLNIDKPKGWTSTDVVRKLKGVTRVRKMGHGGTLDPIASGVLAICLGQGTKFADMFLKGDKEYRLTVSLGEETDTYDAEGSVTRTVPADHVTEAEVESVLHAQIGEISQVPPMYSAVKHNGRRLYELARKGLEVEREPRSVVLYEATLVSFGPGELVVDIRCSHGFYARTFAHELGHSLDTAAHLTDLVRTRSGKLALEDACSISDVEDKAADGKWQDLVLPLDLTLDHLPRVDLDPLKAEMVRHGRHLGVGDLPSMRPGEADLIRVYEDDDLIALLKFVEERGIWQPDKVLSPS